MKKALVLKACMAFTVAAIALGTGYAAAEPWGDGSPGPHGKGHGMYGKPEEGRHQWLEKLNLSAGQKEKIEAIRDEQREAVKATSEQLRAEHEKMRDMMQGDATDAQLREQHGKIHALRTAVTEARFESFLKIRALLTSGQRKRMAKLHHEEMDHHGMRQAEPEIKSPENK